MSGASWKERGSASERLKEGGMDDLAELQALLGAVQKQESKNRLNERNCRELLVKLLEKQLVTVTYHLSVTAR